MIARSIFELNDDPVSAINGESLVLYATFERAVKYRDDIKDTQVVRTTKERAEQDVLYTKEMWEEEENTLAEMDNELLNPRHRSP